MKRSVWGLLVIIVLTLALGCAHADDIHSHDDVTFVTLAEASDPWRWTSADYVLGADLDLSSQQITVTGTVNLCLNGHTLTISRIKLQANSALHLYDCSNGSGVIFSDTPHAYGGNVIAEGANATLYLHSGTIEVNATNTQPVRLEKANCRLIMTGGTILTRTSGSDALCLNNASATAEISGGSIIAADKGANAVKVANGKLIMTDQATLSGGMNAVIILTANGSAELSGGQLIRGSGKLITSSGPALGDMLAENYAFFTDEEAEIKAKYTDTDVSLTGVSTVYILPIPQQYTVSLYMNGELFSAESVKQGGSYTLPLYIEDSNHTVYKVDSYTDGENQYDPSSETLSVTVTQDMSLTIVFTPHRCSGETFITPIDDVILEDYIVANGYTLSAGSYYLPEAIDLSGKTLTVTGKVKLCLNGQQLSVDQIILSKDAELSIYDCSNGETGLILANTTKNLIVSTNSGCATLKLFGGRLQSSASSTIRFDKVNCALLMQGGSIVATGSGQSTVVLVGDGVTAEMTGGSIIADSGAKYAMNATKCVMTISGSAVIQKTGSDTSGAALIVKGTQTQVTFNGGEIKAAVGYALQLEDSGVFAMTDGTIEQTSTRQAIYENGTATLVVSGGVVNAVNTALYLNSDTASVSLSGGDFIVSAASGKPIEIKSSLTKTLNDLLAVDEGGTVSLYDFFQEPEADNKVSATNAEKAITTVKAVYVRLIPEQCLVTIQDSDGNTLEEVTIRKDRELTLPAFVTNEKGEVFAIVSYTYDGIAYKPGDRIVIQADTVIQAVTKQKHTCANGVFDAPIDTDSASSYIGTDFVIPQGSYYLDDDLTMAGTITVSGKVSLCLNGHTVKVYQIKLLAGADLTFCDCSANHEGTFETTETVASLPAIDATAAGTGLHILSGRIVTDGMGISVSNSSVFEMTGGRLVVNGKEECCLKIDGGASVTLSNCTIEGQAARVVNLYNGKLTINDGAELIGNSRTVITTAGQTTSPYIPVYVNHANAELYINGGEITTTLDDAVYLVKYKTFRMSGGTLQGGYDGYTDGRSALYISNNSGGTATISGGTIINQSMNAKGQPRGIGITNYGNLIITGSAVIEGSRYALWNKSQATVTTDVSVEHPDRLTGGVAAICHVKGKLQISGGVLIGGQYGLTVEESANSSATDPNIVTLSGGRYTCTNTTGTRSPVKGIQDVTAFLADDTLGYYLNAEGPQAFTAAQNGFLSDNSMLNPAVNQTAYVRTYDAVPCPHYAWTWQSQQGQSGTIGVCDACGEILVKYVGCSMTISNDLSMTFTIQVYDLGTETPRLLDENWSMHFDRDNSGENDTTPYNTTITAVRDGAYLTFTYHGINPQCMTTPIHADILYTEEAWRKTAEGDRPAVADQTLALTDRTVRDYCVKLYAQGADESTAALMANMLKYGAASQIYNNWYTDKPATGGEASVLMAYALPAEKPTSAAENHPNGDYSIGVTLRLAYQTELVFITGSIPGSARMQIYCGNDLLQDVAVSAGTRSYLPVTPMNYDVLFTAKLVDEDGNILCWRTFSVDTFVMNIWERDTAVMNMLREMYRFGRAAQQRIGKTGGSFVARSVANYRCLVLPAALTEIGESAFENARSLEEVDIGVNVTRIESRAFAGSSVKVVVFPQDSALTYIAPDAFDGTDGVQFVTNGNTVAQIYLGTAGITEYGVEIVAPEYYDGVITLPIIDF